MLAVSYGVLIELVSVVYVKPLLGRVRAPNPIVGLFGYERVEACVLVGVRPRHDKGSNDSSQIYTEHRAVAALELGRWMGTKMEL